MLDTSQWPEVELDVLKEVHLDPKNVRLEVADAKVEADIIEDLFVNEDALGLVEGICKVGYLTHETPVVLKRRGKYVMVEGNRRLAALKAIQNPMLVPDYQARISALAALLPDRSSLSKIRVMIAPNQTQADQLIAAIHTGNLRKAWTPSRQAAFFQAQIDAGRKLKELLTRYPTIDVRKFVFRAHIINLFKSVKYDDAELQDFLATKKWARGLSTLARIYESKEFLELTGLAMQDDGRVTKTVSDAVFKSIATAIVQGMYDENINTRSLNSIKSPRYTQLMGELRRIVADANAGEEPSGNSTSGPPGGVASGASGGTKSGAGAAGGSGSTGTGASSGSGTPMGPASGGTGGTATKQPPAGKKKKPKNLDLGQVKAPDSYPEALKLLLGELSEIDVQKFPNATFLMIRAVLEKSIKAFAEAKSIDIKGTGNSQNGRVQLGHALNWLLDYVKANGPKYLIQVVEGVRTGKLVTYTNSSDSLNALNHNHHFKVDADQAFAMWGSIDSIMRYAMKP
ncbi:hypothetical protein [Nesterenkonia ebinurensis]|uniref:hypothetical protein n=1 Tax=Nesterenkonia ebinurensis TaxID=2608252 RepID=UPI00123D52B8|nr:hypothetical protein [Nesterenkonia ebinurensis]